MDTRAGKRKAEQASDLPAAGGAAKAGSKIKVEQASDLPAAGGAAKAGSKTFDLAAYRLAVENAKSYAADALQTLQKFRSDRIVENLYFCVFLFTVVNNNHGDSPSPQDPWKRTCEIYSFRKTI
jgi:hypothetical protein